MIRLWRILYHPYTWMYGIFLWVLGRLDEHRASGLADALVPLFTLPFRSQLRSNLKRFFGLEAQPSNDRVVSLERTHLRYLSTLTASFARLPEISQADLERSVVVTGEEHISAALRLGRGALLMMDHFGNGWHWMALLASRGYRISVLSNRTPMSVVNRHILRIARRFTFDLVRPGLDAFRQAREVLNRNEIFVLTCDASIHSRNCQAVPFGNAYLQVHLGPGVLAIRSRAPVLRMMTKVLPSGQSHTSVAPPLEIPPATNPRMDSAALLRSWIGELEEATMANPEQWFLWGYVPLGDAPTANLPPCRTESASAEPQDAE